ncbi:response regulator [Nitrincola nitratireducens]|uniref:Stalked cell differentiation-controlling protein n=1 Tax=Nitrincola nitratireducens TaxID=1229521 RepID=W9UYD2_9GAMM|nr:response regulator [Nitrincola nitratireducens]EXJ12243.1 Stalked cell differentiation-controlling protein [Nitrincola nitratireducens]
MQADRKRILIVDDSPFDISFVVNTLQGHYNIQVATNGKAAVEITQSSIKPDLILMDVQMPEMSGFEACQEIKDNFETENIDIIFLSGLTSTEEKLKGYDVGACDFISKPIEPKELLRKIDIAIAKRAQREALLEEKNSIFKTAMTAITSAGEVGAILEFTRKLFSIKSSEDLAREVVNTLSNFDLHASIVLLTEEGPIFASSNEPMSELEQSLLIHLDAADRIFEKGSRTMFNFYNANLLIKNAPSDSDTRGRYRDIFAMMMDSVVECHKRLQFDKRLALLSIDARQALNSMSHERKQHIKEGESILQTLLLDLEKSFMAWGLIEDQEILLTSMVHKAVDSYENHTLAGKKIDQHMQSIINRLLTIQSHD